jgi:chromosome segregation ATPase
VALSAVKTVNDVVEAVNVEVAGLKETLSQTRKDLEIVDGNSSELKTAVNRNSKNLLEMEKKYPVLEAAWKTLETKHQSFIKETESKKLLETQDAEAKLKERDVEIEEMKKTLKEAQEQIDTLKLKYKPDFKGAEQSPEKTGEDNKVLDWKKPPYT